MPSAEYPAFCIASRITSIPSSFEDKFGAKPPSSPTDVLYPLFYRTSFKLWKTSIPILTASLKFTAPVGAIINS